MTSGEPERMLLFPCQNWCFVKVTPKNTMFFAHSEQNVAFRCRGEMLICTNHQFLQRYLWFLGHYDKTISFCDELSMSKHSSFTRVVGGALSIDFLRGSAINWPSKDTNRAKTSVFATNYVCLRTTVKMHINNKRDLSKIYIDLSHATHKCNNLL